MITGMKSVDENILNIKENYLIFVDETGEPSFKEDEEFYKDQTRFPCLTLTAVILKKEDYCNLMKYMCDLKIKYFQREDITLHNRAIRKKEGPFSIFEDEKLYSEFKNDIVDMLDKHNILLVSCSINKLKLIERRKTFEREGFEGEEKEVDNLYKTCVEWMLERVCDFLNKHSCRGKLIFEKIGKKESNQVKETFSNLIKKGNSNHSWGKVFSFSKKHFSCVSKEILFHTKEDSVTGLEVADYVCYPFGKHCRNPGSDNELFHILKKYIYQGDRFEYGFKEWPE